MTATSTDGSVTAGANTNTSGSYTITVEPGTYCVSFGVDSNTPASTTYGGAPNCRAGATPVTVGSGLAVGTIDAVVRLGLIAGTLRDRVGAPIAGASIFGDLVAADSFIRMTTSPVGEFAIKDLLPGTYCLAALPAPARLMDTRPGESTVDGQAAGGGAVTGGVVRELQVTGRGGIPVNAAAVVLNVTAAGGTGPGFLTVFPCGAIRPTASNVNYVAGQVIPNAVFTRVGADGRVCLFAPTTVEVIVDIAGSFLA